MQMDAGLDTGPMLLREAVPITATTTAATLHDSAGRTGCAADPARPGGGAAAGAAAGRGRDLRAEADA